MGSLPKAMTLQDRVMMRFIKDRTSKIKEQAASAEKLPHLYQKGNTTNESTLDPDKIIQQENCTVEQRRINIDSILTQDNDALSYTQYNQNSSIDNNDAGYGYGSGTIDKKPQT